MVRLHIQVEAILFRFINGSCEYLLLKRIDRRGGFWQPVTGGLEEGEELPDAVVREVKEETGITKLKRIIPGIYQFTFGEKPFLKEYVFGAEINPSERIVFDKNVYEEHDNYRWCSYKEALQLLKWPGNKKGLTNLHTILKKKKI